MREYLDRMDSRRGSEDGGDLRTTLLIISLSLALVMLLVTAAVFPLLSFVVVIIMVVVVLVYASYVIMAKFKGYMVNPITECLYLMGPTLGVFIVLLIGPGQFPSNGLGYLALPALLLGSTIAVNPLAKVRNMRLSVTVRSLILIFTGILLFMIMSQFGQGTWGEAILLGLALAGAIGLLGLFREHSDPLLRDLGRAVDRNFGTAILALVMVLVSVYAVCLRPSILNSNRSLVGALEWVVVALVVSAFAIMAFKRVAKHRAEGSYLKQQETDAIASSPVLISSDLAVATEAVRAFIDRGNSKRVIVLIACSLKDNGLGDSEIADLIGELVDYREEEVALVSAWTYGDIQKQRRSNRIALLSRVLSTASLRSQMRANGTAGMRLR